MSQAVRRPERATDATPARAIRVLWLIKGLGPGGAEFLLSMMAEVRDRQAFEYEAAYLLPWKDQLVADLEAKGVVVHCLGGGREWDLRWVTRLRRLVRERRYDVVHVHSPYVAGVARLAVRTMPASVRPRLVYTEHVPWRWYGGATRLLNRLTYGLDDAHVAVSGAVRESIPPPHRSVTRVVIHGVPVDAVRRELSQRKAVRAELGVREGEVLIGTVANFRPQKRYPDLLRAARLVLDQGLPARFVAVGQGPLEPEIRRLHGQLGLGDRFLLAGYRADAARILAGCDVFVLASLFEGLPVALMEALALGLPVVATDVDGVRGEVRICVEPILVPPARPVELAAGLRSVVGDPDLRMRLGAAARARASRYDVRSAAGAIEAIYREAVT